MAAARPSVVGMAVCLYCGWQCADLLRAWGHAPLERFAWVALLIWCAPVAWMWPRGSEHDAEAQGCPALLGLGLCLALAGALGSLNVIQHVGLALAIGGLLPWSGKRVFWLASAVSWMPVFGWLAGRCAGLDAPHVLVVRLLLAASVAAGTVYALRRDRRCQT